MKTTKYFVDFKIVNDKPEVCKAIVTETKKGFRIRTYSAYKEDIERTVETASEAFNVLKNDGYKEVDEFNELSIKDLKRMSHLIPKNWKEKFNTYINSER